MIYELSRKALRQIEEVIRYTDEHFGEEQTREYLAGLYYSFDLLSDNPGMDRPFDEYSRRHIYRSHIVYYRILDDRIQVIDIRSARQSPFDG